MAYVDLNLIRAKMEVTPETSKHTSIQHLIQALIKGEQPKNLMRFVGNHRQDMPKGIAYSLIDYCELVDSTGRCIREDKAGYIEHRPILEGLRLDTKQWLTLTTEFEQHFSTAVGSEHMLQQFKHHTSHITQTINHQPSTYTRDGKGHSFTSIRLNYNHIYSQSH
jgi:hypothetical protein